jgi:hypothetical protein
MIKGVFHRAPMAMTLINGEAGRNDEEGFCTEVLISYCRLPNCCKSRIVNA